MLPISEAILDRYQVRKTRRQKTAFIDFLRQTYPELKVEEAGRLKSRNLILGDPETAQVLLTAHYDTCAVLPVPNFLAPQNLLLTVLYSLLICVPMLLVMAAVEVGMLWLTDSFLLSYWVSFAVLIGLIVWVFFLGRPNRHTVNDNTSGVITLLELWEGLTPAQREKAAFVFFDNEEVGLIGSGCYRKRHKAAIQNQLVLNFDCVSDGEHLLLVQSKKARQRWEGQLAAAFRSDKRLTLHMARASTTLYPSDQAGFPQGVGVAAVKRKPIVGLYLDRIHTKRDTVMREENIEFLVEATGRFLDTV